ncbi:MAG: hypothetical protein OXB93_02035 [Cytophagales bacterium]|nr:hypothetical protein [Cytophagales bacterium]
MNMVIFELNYIQGFMLHACLCRFLKKRGPSLIIVLNLFYPLSAQIVDDSTQTIYGTKETYFYYTSDLLHPLSIPKRIPDTTLYHIAEVDPIEIRQRSWTNLGNTGTALRPLFPFLSRNIEQETGLSAYDAYFQSLDSIQHYHSLTRPYLYLSGHLGQQGRSSLDLRFSQNLNPALNIFLGLNRIDSDKQIGASLARDDRNVISTSYHFRFNYSSTDSLFVFLGSWEHQDHNVEETGGIWVPEQALRTEYFQYQRATVRLLDAEQQNKRRRVHLLQRIQLHPNFYPYLSLLREKQENLYTDNINLNTRDSLIYRKTRFSENMTSQFMGLQTWVYEWGGMGKHGGLSYRLYAKKRNLHFTDSDSTRGHMGIRQETHTGAEYKYNFSPKYQWQAEMVQMNGAHYNFSSRMISPHFLIKGRYTKRPPPLFAQYHNGNHQYWDQDLIPEHVYQIAWEGQFSNTHDTIPKTILHLKPQISLVGRKNMVYFAQDRLPYQSANTWQHMGQYGFSFENRFLENRMGFYTQVLRQHRLQDPQYLLRFPEWWGIGRVFYQDTWFEDYLRVHIGVDFHVHSRYHAHAYHPITQQFYLQDDVKIGGYLPLNFFFNVGIENFRGFLKIIHFNQLRNSGYFATPNYPAEKRLFNVGFSWAFFD